MERRHADYQGFQLAYIDEGSGAPIVLVPGVMMSIDRWVDVGYVDALVGAGRRVIAVDPLGHGGSTKTSDVEAYTVERLVDHLVAVLDDAGVDRSDVWGYSRGSFMSSELAAARPERVRKLVAGGIPLFDLNELMEQMGTMPDQAEIDDRHRRCLGGDWGAYWEGFPLPLPDDTKAFLSERNDLASISACRVASFSSPPTWRAPGEIDTLAYWGRSEVFHDLNVEAAAAQPVQTATVDGGHGEAFAEVDAVLAEVLPFLG